MIVAQITVNAESVTFTTVTKRTSPGDATVIVGVGSRVAVEVLVGEETAVLVGVDVAVLVGVLVAVGVFVSAGAIVGVLVGVSVGVFVTIEVTVGVGVGSRIVRLSDRVALTVRAPPAALVNERFVKSIEV